MLDIKMFRVFDFFGLEMLGFGFGVWHCGFVIADFVVCDSGFAYRYSVGGDKGLGFPISGFLISDGGFGVRHSSLNGRNRYG